MRATAVQLSEEQLTQLAGMVAARVVAAIDVAENPMARPGLVDAAALARLLGVERAWIYEHSRELAGVRLGDGPKPRLRFDPEVAQAAVHRPGGQAVPGARPQH